MEQTKKAKERSLRIEIIKQLITLSSSGFGVVAALAWNGLIQEIVGTYIKPYLPQGSGVISLLLYAVIVTIIAVFITYQLTNILKRLENIL
jgi:hypothetical protein